MQRKLTPRSSCLHAFLRLVGIILKFIYQRILLVGYFICLYLPSCTSSYFAIISFRRTVSNPKYPCFVLQLPIEDLCSLSSRSLQSPFTATVPASVEDILLKGFQILDMENDRIETAQQVIAIVFIVNSAWQNVLKRIIVM